MHLFASMKPEDILKAGRKSLYAGQAEQLAPA
jgi:hypothetical protein